MTRTARIAHCAAIGGVFGYALQATIPGCRDLVGDSFEVWGYPLLFLLTGGICIARATQRHGQRAAWAIVGVGLVCSGAGDIYWNVAIGDSAARGFTVADALWLVFYPACLAGLVLLARGRVDRLRASLALDALVAALGLTAVGAALAFGAVLSERAIAPGDFALDALMFGCDLVLLGATVAVLAITAWRPGRALGLVAVALVLSAVVDAFSIWQGATGSNVKLTTVEALLPLAALLLATAAWQPSARTAAVRAEGWRSIALSVAFAGGALALLVVNLIRPVNALALALAVATLAAAIARMAMALGEHTELLGTSRREALTDALTGLGNRRLLMCDLEREAAAASDADPRALLMFDLDGFKQYNDWHGHPAGDALLTDIGARLEAATAGSGRPYRLGGDEFCVIVRGGELEARRVRAGALEALSQSVDGFEVSSSCGLVMVPAEAVTATAALGLADERLYAQKARRRRFSVGRQTASALVQALSEREPNLRHHSQGVADLARAVAGELGLRGEELDQVVRAAELHDVGKMAVPDSILLKPGPLSDSEWDHVREHTLVGDRIVGAAPALTDVASLVRASHERYDGRGYPDRLMGEEIPLGARIVTVCDAYAAMTSDRPYRPAVAPEEALGELERCAGRQFDPAVVAAFAQVVSVGTTSRASAGQ